MTSGVLHLMRTSNKYWLAAVAGWRPLLALLALALASTACTKGTSDIGVGLPSSQSNTGAYLVDTITVRASTVLRDSVVTSNSAFLHVGRATDPLFGTLTAKSFVRLGLSEAFRPDATFIFDSVTLVLNPDNYRYGDTTKTQALVEVHQLIDPISATRPSFSSSKYTNLRYNTAPLNKGGAAPVRRARPNITTLRLPLEPTFGLNLMKAGQAGLIATQDQLDAYLPGLVLTGAATDNAAILRLNALSATSGITVYYHDPLNSTVALSALFNFELGARHFYQIEADRSTAGLSGLPTASLQRVDASATGQQTFIEGAIGLQTKLEFPYLVNLLEFGTNLTITSANITALVPNNTLSTYVPQPPSIAINLSDALNRPAGTYISNVPYLRAVSSTTGLEQGSYEWSVQTYIQNVLNRSTPNNGLLLAPALLAPTGTTPVTAPELPNRVVLGGPRSLSNRLQLRLYLIQIK
jgi:hypothetical protein